MRTQPTLELYSYWRSSCSWRVRIALAIKGLKFTTKTINLLKDEQSSDSFKSINPVGFVPALIVDGKTVLIESMAILEYLEEAFPDTPRLLPENPADRAIVRALAYQIASTTQPLQNLQNGKLAFPDDAEKRLAYTRGAVERGLRGLELLLEKYSGTYAFGDTITFADVVIPPQVYGALRFGVDMSQFPIITKVNDNLSKLESFIVADCYHQPDTPADSRPTV